MKVLIVMIIKCQEISLTHKDITTMQKVQKIPWGGKSWYSVAQGVAFGYSCHLMAITLKQNYSC